MLKEEVIDRIIECFPTVTPEDITEYFSWLTEVNKRKNLSDVKIMFYEAFPDVPKEEKRNVLILWYMSHIMN